jgi:Uma2 family endonuclease
LIGRLDGETRIAIHGISYEFYKQFCDEIGEQPIRLSFNDGCLEITITKSPHEFFKTLLAKLVEATIFELDMPVRSGGAMTFQRDDLKKGFEPDECWWIQHEAAVRTTTEFDFNSDPPPDLAIEVEISHSLAKRIQIYAALGVPEVWRFDGQQLRFCRLESDGSYVDESSSLAFPFLRPENLMPLLKLPDDNNETRRIKSYVNWLRSTQKTED